MDLDRAVLVVVTLATMAINPRVKMMAVLGIKQILNLSCGLQTVINKIKTPANFTLPAFCARISLLLTGLWPIRRLADYYLIKNEQRLSIGESA